MVQMQDGEAIRLILLGNKRTPTTAPEVSLKSEFITSSDLEIKDFTGGQILRSSPLNVWDLILCLQIMGT